MTNELFRWFKREKMSKIIISGRKRKVYTSSIVNYYSHDGVDLNTIRYAVLGKSATLKTRGLKLSLKKKTSLYFFPEKSLREVSSTKKEIRINKVYLKLGSSLKWDEQGLLFGRTSETKKSFFLLKSQRSKNEMKELLPDSDIVFNCQDIILCRFKDNMLWDFELEPSKDINFYANGRPLSFFPKKNLTFQAEWREKKEKVPLTFMAGRMICFHEHDFSPSHGCLANGKVYINGREEEGDK